MPRRLAPLLFPLALWFLATFFLLGDLGKYNDDWFYLLRDPATGRIQALYLTQELQFWRPLYRLIVPSLITLLWHADWLNHLISAAAHGAAALLLWRLLLLLRIPRPGAAVAALFFLVWPAHFEAVLWLCSLPTILSLILVLTAWILHVRHARAELGPWTIAATPLLFFASACLNEQATTGLAALPFLYFGATGHGSAWPVSDATGHRFAWPVALRTLIPTALAAGALALYVAIHAALHFRPPVTDRDAFSIPLSEIPSAAIGTLHWVKVQFTSPDYFGRALSAGLATLAAHPLRTALVAIALASGLVPWARSLAHANDPDDHPRPAWVALAGLAAFIATLAPIVVFSYWHNPRLLYAPALGLAILIAAASASLAQRFPSPPSRRALIVALAGAFLVLPAIAMVGFQRGYHDRARRDTDEVAQLKSLIPDPPPGAVFVPVRIDRPESCARRAAVYDQYYRSALAGWWSARHILRFAYARDDLTAGDPAWTRPTILHLSADRADIRNVGDIPLPLLIPFTIDLNSRISLVTELRSGPLSVPIPITCRIVRERALPPHAESVP